MVFEKTINGTTEVHVGIKLTKHLDYNVVGAFFSANFSFPELGYSRYEANGRSQFLFENRSSHSNYF